MKKMTLKNLDCAHCASQIEKGIKTLDCVYDAKVIFATKTLMIDTNDMDAVKNKIKEIEDSVTVEENIVKDEEEFNVKKELTLFFSLLLLYFAGIAVNHYFGETVYRYIAYAIFLAVYFVSGKEVIFASFKNIRKGRIFDENFLMTFATAAAWVIGSYSEAVGVMLFYRAGEFFQDLAVNRSRRSIKSLMEIRPDTACVIRNGKENVVSPDEISVGEVILVKAGEKIALDGEIIKGKSTVDSRALTGESVPRGVSHGDKVLAGMVNLTGVIEVRAEKLFKESSASKILDLVENAAANKAKTENFITVFASYYTPIVFFIALMIAVLPPVLGFGTFSEWIYKALVALVVSCPCALVISIPLGYFGGIGGASRKGILVKGANYLEALANVKSIAFDKTGTLTKGVFNVTEIRSESSYSDKDILLFAAIAESKSNHPIARSIVEYAGKSDYHIDEYEEISGMGVRVISEGREILAGNDRLLHFFGVDHSSDICAVKGSVAHIAVNGEYAGYIIISDELKEDTIEAVNKLKSAGVENMLMLTGDNQFSAENIATKVGIKEFYYDLLPEDKARIFQEFTMKHSNEGKTVFAGDGINDAPVLVMADIGISMGGAGSDAAIETADVVIMNDSLVKIYDAVKVAKKTRAIIWQNIIFALLVKVSFIILGLFGIAGMWEAVFGDVGVALIALLNSLRALK